MPEPVRPCQDGVSLAAPARIGLGDAVARPALRRRPVCVRPLAACVAALLMAGAVAGGFAEEPSSSSEEGFGAFRIVVDRNIFDPNREQPRPNPQTAPPPEQPDQLDLVGVLISEREAVAFFEGAGATGGGACKRGQTVGSYTVSAIDTSTVTLERAGEKIQLAVGRRLNTWKNGKWEVVQAPAGSSPRSGAGESADPARDRQSSSPREKQGRETNATDKKPGEKTGKEAGSSDDVLKRLMERRQKEMGQ